MSPTLIASVTPRPDLTATETGVATGTNAALQTQISQLVQTNEAQPSRTPTPVIPPSAGTSTSTPTPFATFSVATFPHTATPAAPAACPAPAEAGPTEIPDFFNWEFWETLADPNNFVLDFLNAYGPKPILDARDVAEAQEAARGPFFYRDVTNDGVPELGMATRFLAIFGCEGGMYKVLFKQPDVDGYLSIYSVEYILDGNRNGIPEIVVISGRLSQGGHYYRIYEWTGDGFENILVPEYSDQPPEIAEIFVEATGRVEFYDVDGDFVLELVAERGLPVWSTYDSGVPWRNETRIHRWDGSRYIYSEQHFSEPEYRFQAVHDGDRFTLLGDYDAALAMYQAAIFDPDLEWWSVARAKYEIDLWNYNLFPNSSEPAPVLPPPDGDEYFYLAAYARFRIMLLHLLRGWEDEARIVYDSLQQLFSAETTGHEFAEMAAAFWSEYLSTDEITSSCVGAIDFISNHQDVLTYLGAFHHGDLSIWYGPRAVCPFDNR